jgi:hypothetical protein
VLQVFIDTLEVILEPHERKPIKPSEVVTEVVTEVVPEVEAGIVKT